MLRNIVNLHRQRGEQQSAQRLLLTLALLAGLCASLMYHQPAQAAADAIDATGSPITLLNTYSGNVDYTAIGNSFTSTELSCDNLGTTSRTLSIPAGSTIKAAYLYWAGSGSTVDSSVVLNGVALAAQQTWQRSFVGNGTNYYYFGARADVTNQVSDSGSYSVSGLSYNAGSPYCSTYATLGTWSLVVIYENSSIPSQIVKLYDGFIGDFRGPSGTSNSTTLINNLPVNIPNSCTQSVQLTHITQEGDSYKGEYLYINNYLIGDNTYNGSTAPNLDIDTYNITSLLTTLANIEFKTVNYLTASPYGNAQESYMNHVFLVKYRSCILPTPTPTNTPVPPTATPVPPTATPVPPTATPVPPTATPLPTIADLALTKTASVTSMTSGVPFNYTLVVANNGPGTALNVVITDPLPAGFTVNAITPSAGGSCANTSGTIHCTWAALVNGASAAVVINVTP